MITRDEALARIGDRVIYRPHPSAPEEVGEISSVGTSYVFVRFAAGAAAGAKACHPSTLEWADG